MSSRRYRRKSGSSGRHRISGRQKLQKTSVDKPPTEMTDIGPDDFIKLDEEGNILNEMPPDLRRHIEKEIKHRPFAELYNLSLGLPSRIRRCIKKAWKLEDRGAAWLQISEEIAPIAAKILNHRIEIVAFASIAVFRDRDSATTERVQRVSLAVAESDALLTIYSSYFICGVSAQLTGQCCAIADGGKRAFVIGGVADVVNFGLHTSQKRQTRRLRAQKDVKDYRWKLPKRD